MASGAGADRTYGEGDTIRVRVDFADPVEVTGTPRLKIDMDPADWGEKWASYESGSGTGSLLFSHAVVEPNYSSQGIAVLANSLELNGGTIRAEGVDADLAHDGRAHDADHKVNWQTASDGGESGLGVEDPLSGTQAPVASGRRHGGSDAGGNSGPPTVTGVKVVSDPGDGRHLHAGRHDPDPGDLQRGGERHRQPAALDRHEPEGVGHEAGGLRERQRHRGASTFTHTVVEPNYAPQGIAVLANSLALNGGTIRSAASSANATLAHTNRPHDSGHKVDWRPAVSVADASATEGSDANGRVHGLAEPRLHHRGAPGDGGLRHVRRYGDRGRGLHRDERHADLRRGRGHEDGERARPRRHGGRGQRDVHAHALERRRARGRATWKRRAPSRTTTRCRRCGSRASGARSRAT